MVPPMVALRVESLRRPLLQKLMRLLEPVAVSDMASCVTTTIPRENAEGLVVLAQSSARTLGSLLSAAQSGPQCVSSQEWQSLQLPTPGKVFGKGSRTLVRSKYPPKDDRPINAVDIKIVHLIAGTPSYKQTLGSH